MMRKTLASPLSQARIPHNCLPPDQNVQQLSFVDSKPKTDVESFDWEKLKLICSFVAGTIPVRQGPTLSCQERIQVLVRGMKATPILDTKTHKKNFLALNKPKDLGSVHHLLVLDDLFGA